MKKIRINEVIEGSESETVGTQLEIFLRTIPSDSADEAVRKVMIAKELKLANDKKDEWFVFEDSDEAVMSVTLDKAAKAIFPVTIATIKMSLKKAVAFKGVEPKEEEKKDSE